MPRKKQLYTEVWIWDYTQNINKVKGYTHGFGVLIIPIDGQSELIHFNAHWVDHKKFIPDNTSRENVISGKLDWQFHGELPDAKAVREFKDQIIKAFLKKKLPEDV